MLLNSSVPGRPTNSDNSRAKAYSICSCASGGCLDIIVFSLSSIISLTPSLWETARYRLKYCLKGPLNPKQTDNQPFAIPKQCTLFLRL